MTAEDAVFLRISAATYEFCQQEAKAAKIAAALAPMIPDKYEGPAKQVIKILIEEIDLPIIVDAGIGAPSHAAEAMEMGADAVLANTAVATEDALRLKALQSTASHGILAVK